MLGGDVGRFVRLGDEARPGRGHDHPSPGPCDVWPCVLDRKPWTFDHDGEQSVPLAFGKLRDRRYVLGACVEDRRVEAAVSLERRIHHRLIASVGADVEAQSVALDVDRDDLGSFAVEDVADRDAQAAGGAGHDGHPSRQPHVSTP